MKIGDKVKKIKGSEWTGTIVGTYSTELTPAGFCVESDAHKGSVQIYPEAALQVVEEGPLRKPHRMMTRDAMILELALLDGKAPRYKIDGSICHANYLTSYDKVLPLLTKLDVAEYIKAETYVTRWHSKDASKIPWHTFAPEQIATAILHAKGHPV